MKRFVMAVVLIVAVVSGVFAQAGKTNCYAYVETVTKEGGRKKTRDTNYMYITFTNNSCYVSDEKGNNQKEFVLSYRGEQNNVYVYSSVVTDRQYGSIFENVFIFSKDYKRVDIIFNLTTSYMTLGDPEMFVQVEPVTRVAVIPSTNLAKLSQISTTQNPQSASAPNSPSYPVPVNPTPNYPSPSNGGGSTVGNRLPCKNCNGTGKHPRCNGTGRIQCTICYGRDKNCFTCKGTGTTQCPEFGYNCQAGRCLQCRGTGWINL
jgi:hypothetical protein